MKMNAKDQSTDRSPRVRPGDLTRNALQRLVEQLLEANEGEEQRILDRLANQEADDKERNDLADLVEEKRGKPSTVTAEDEEEKPSKKRMA
jgi:hypothetical protein